MNNQKRPALGKGIASLLQSSVHPEVISKAAERMKEEDKLPAPAPVVTENTSTHEGSYLIDIESIKVNPSQPRKIFKEKEIEELSFSIKENGIIQPLIVSKTATGVELISGERRLRAAKKAGLEKVPVVFKQATDKEKVVMAIVENVQRSDLNCVEEALAYYRLMEEFHLTQEEVAKKIGKERSTIANFLRILKLPREVIELLQKESLSFGHAKILAGITDGEKIKKLSLLVIKQGLSVRELEKLIQQSDDKKLPDANTDDFSNKIEALKTELERRTNLKVKITGKKGVGNFQIYFGDEAEFNAIYELLMRKS